MIYSVNSEDIFITNNIKLFLITKQEVEVRINKILVFQAPQHLQSGILRKSFLMRDLEV
jgi:hypothetical protein